MNRNYKELLAYTGCLNLLLDEQIEARVRKDYRDDVNREYQKFIKSKTEVVFPFQSYNENLIKSRVKSAFMSPENYPWIKLIRWLDNSPIVAQEIERIVDGYEVPTKDILPFLEKRLKQQYHSHHSKLEVTDDKIISHDLFKTTIASRDRVRTEIFDRINLKGIIDTCPSLSDFFTGDITLENMIFDSFVDYAKCHNFKFYFFIECEKRLMQLSHSISAKDEEFLKSPQILFTRLFIDIKKIDSIINKKIDNNSEHREKDVFYYFSDKFKKDPMPFAIFYKNSFLFEDKDDMEISDTGQSLLECYICNNYFLDGISFNDIINYYFKKDKNGDYCYRLNGCAVYDWTTADRWDREARMMYYFEHDDPDLGEWVCFTEDDINVKLNDSLNELLKKVYKYIGNIQFYKKFKELFKPWLKQEEDNDFEICAKIVDEEITLEDYLNELSKLQDELSKLQGMLKANNTPNCIQSDIELIEEEVLKYFCNEVYGTIPKSLSDVKGSCELENDIHNRFKYPRNIHDTEYLEAIFIEIEEKIDYIAYYVKTYIEHNKLVREDYYLDLDYDFLYFLKKLKQEEFHYLQQEIIKNSIDCDKSLSLSSCIPLASHYMSSMKNHRSKVKQR